MELLDLFTDILFSIFRFDFWIYIAIVIFIYFTFILIWEFLDNVKF